MNILFLTLLDFSSSKERGIYTDLIREFLKAGHDVYAISPEEKRKHQSERLIDDGNCKILKLQIGNIQKTNILEKGISTLTMESKFKGGINHYFLKEKFDLILYSTPPITFLSAVSYVKNRDSAMTYLLLKDIFPQNAVDLGMIKKYGLKSLIYKYFRNKEKKLYEISDFIGCMSKANVKYLIENNSEINSKIVEICPNSIEPRTIIKNIDKTREIRAQYNVPSDRTVFIYGGNLGKPQGIDFLIECLKSNKKNDKVFFLIVGSGTEFIKLNDFILSENPENTKLFTHLSKNDYEILLNSCDVGLLFLDKRFTIPNFPSRMLSYMQASMPILAVTDSNSDVGSVIKNGNFGWGSISGDIKEFNINLNKLCNIELRELMGKNARMYLEENYTSKHSFDIIMNHFDLGEDI